MQTPNLTRRSFIALTLPLLPIVQPGRAFAALHPRIALIFVGASWCPVCHAAAAVLAPASDRSDLDVLVASQDGKPISPWPDFVDARGHPLTADVKALPTLLFVDLASSEIIARIEGFGTPGSYLTRVRATLKAAVEAGHG